MRRGKPTSTSCRAMRHRLELVNPGCRRLPPRYATRFLPPPENASGNCLFPGRAWPKHLARRNGLLQRHRGGDSQTGQETRDEPGAVAVLARTTKLGSTMISFG